MAHYYTAGNHISSTNFSLVTTAHFNVFASLIPHCQEKYVEWEIVRADGVIEVYNATPQGDYYYMIYQEEYPEKGLRVQSICDYNHCYLQLRLRPTDLRYNGAQISCTFSLPECNSINITQPKEIKIQGKYVTPLIALGV